MEQTPEKAFGRGAFWAKNRGLFQLSEHAAFNQLEPLVCDQQIGPLRLILSGMRLDRMCRDDGRFRITWTSLYKPGRASKNPEEYAVPVLKFLASSKEAELAQDIDLFTKKNANTTAQVRCSAI